MAVIYKVTNTAGVDQFSIQEGTFDGPGGFQAHTNLQLHGYGYKQWGQNFDNNFYKLLENFACPESVSLPGSPQGEAELLGVGSGTGIDHPVSGQTWYNTTNNNLYVFDGANWNALVTTASLNTISYDQSTADARFVNVTGDTMTGGLTVQDYLGTSALAVVDTNAGTFVQTTVRLSDGPGIHIGGYEPGTGLIQFYTSGGLNPNPGLWDSSISATGGNSVLSGQGNLTVHGNLFTDRHPAAGVAPADNYKVATKYYVDTQAPAGFPAGTTLPFYQAAAPTGWTQNVTFNDYMLRVVNTAGGGNGGSDSPILNNKVAAHTHPAASVVTDPGHTHTYNQAGGGQPKPNSNGTAPFDSYSSVNTGSKVTGITVATTVSNNGSAANWAPKYLNIIICAKN